MDRQRQFLWALVEGTILLIVALWMSGGYKPSVTAWCFIMIWLPYILGRVVQQVMISIAVTKAREARAEDYHRSRAIHTINNQSTRHPNGDGESPDSSS